MKKLIAILLVLLVASVAFGAENDFGDSLLEASTPVEGPSDVTLTLQANAPGRFVHGFAADSATASTFGQIVNYTFDETVIKTVDLTLATTQDLAKYLIATNTRDEFTVTLTAEPLKSEQFVNEDYYYVNYTLGVGTNDVEVDGTDDFIALYTDYSVTGVLAASYDIDFTLDQSYLVDEEIELPEGNYSATITVAVTGM